MCLCYPAGSCWCYRRYAVRAARHKLRHRALALEGPFCSALTSRRRMRRCTRSRVTTRSTDTPLARDTEDTDEKKKKKNLTGIIKDVSMNFNVCLSCSPAGACSMSDLDTSARRRALTARCQRRKGRPPCPGKDASLSSGPGRMTRNRSSTGSRAHTPGREGSCTPVSHSHTHCRGGREIRACTYRPEPLSSKNICLLSLSLSLHYHNRATSINFATS